MAESYSLVKIESFCPRIGNSSKDANSSPLPFNIVPEVLARSISQEKEIKDSQIRKKEIKLSLLKDNIILYIENPKNSTWNY